MSYKHTLSFRFDIDTHKCIRDGVLPLMQLAQDEGVRFSFFLNLGRSVSFWESVKSILTCNCKFFAKADDNIQVEMMSAMEKLGVADYLYAALINPPIYTYKQNIRLLCKSNNEVGIHGGKNHEIWHKKAFLWDEKRVKNEIEFAISSVNRICENFKPSGFASPGWTTPESLPKVLKEMQFDYYADYRCCGQDNVVDVCGILPRIGVNLLGEPGGVAFFENCRVRKMRDEDILFAVKESVETMKHTVLYDHPYYAGINEIEMIREIINMCKSSGVNVIGIGELL